MGGKSASMTALDRAAEADQTRRIAAGQKTLDADRRRRKARAQIDPLLGPGGQVGTTGRTTAPARPVVIP